MRKRLGWILILVAMVYNFAQTSSSKYQPGTITAVVAHQNSPGESSSDIVRYDVSVEVGNTEYVVLYTPPNGANSVEYSVGMELLVLVGSNDLTFNSKLSGTTDVPILRRQVLTAKSGLDLSRIPSQYFAMKQRHLSEVLRLTDDQQAKIKPILEQEAGEASQFLGNPVISRKDQMNRWEKLVQASDAKIKPFLTQAQADQLQALRREQKQDLKKLTSDSSAATQN